MAFYKQCDILAAISQAKVPSMAIPSQEETPRRIIEIMAVHFAGGVRAEDLRRQFELDTGLARQCFYNNFKLIRQWGWIIGSGGINQIYELNPAAPWKVSPSIGGQDGGTEAEQLRRAKQEATRLEYLVDTQAGEIQELRDQLDDLRVWTNGDRNGVAVPSLVAIVSDPSATLRQKLKAAGAILGYKVQDPSVSAFTRRLLESICASADVPTDYKIQAAETLRRAEGDTQLRPSIERVAPPAPVIDPVKEAEERKATHERRRAHLERQAALDQAELVKEWERRGWSRPPAPQGDCPENNDSQPRSEG
jgi:hypothetical protein